MMFSVRFFVGVIFTVIFFVPAALFAATPSAGIPTEPIWFSVDSFFEGDEIIIFAPLYNSSAYRFRGRVELHDGTTTLGAQPFTLLEGSSQIFSFPWKATRGEHTFGTVIVGGEFLSADKSFVDLPISAGTTGTVKRSVEHKEVAPLSASSTTENLFTEGVKATKYLSTEIPASIIAKTLPILGSVEAFRVGQAAYANDMEEKIVAGLSSGNDPSLHSTGWDVFKEGVVKGDVIHSPWEYVKLFFVLCYQFLTTHIYVFYIFCSYVLYLIIRFAISLFS